MPSTQEWQVVESAKPVRKVPPADTTAERAGSNRWLPNAVPESTSAMSGEAPVADSGSAERAAQKALSMAAKRGSTPATPGSRIAPTQEGPVSLASATFDDLRALGLSVTQAKRVLNFRERLDGFDSVDDLNHVPGFPKSILSELKSQVTL